jgi:hypothetical protein
MENIQSNDMQSNIIIEQKESLKLIKMTKGYNWEIKLTSLDVDKLEKLNNEMINRFGQI